MLHDRKIRLRAEVLRTISNATDLVVPLGDYVREFSEMLSLPFRKRIERLLAKIYEGAQIEKIGPKIAAEGERYLRLPLAERLRQELEEVIRFPQISSRS